MSVRPHPTKGPGWWIIDTGRGKDRRKRSFEGTYAEAVAGETSLTGRQVPRKESTIVQIYLPFIDWYAIHRLPATVAACKDAWDNHLIPHYGSKYLSCITQLDHDKYKAKRLQDKFLQRRKNETDESYNQRLQDAPTTSKRTINIELLYLRSGLAFAKKQGYDIGALPELFEKRYTKAAKPVVLSGNELFELLDNLQGEKKLQVMLMGMVGLRKGEIKTMTRGQVDLVNSIIHVIGKGDKERIVPMPPILLVAMAEQCARKNADDQELKRSDLLFTIKDIRKAMRTAAEKAGIDKHVYPHLFRHTSGAIAAGAGIQQRSIQELLGHADIRTTEIYTQLAANSLKDAVSRMSRDIVHKIPESKEEHI